MPAIDVEDGLVGVLHFDQLVPIDILVVHFEVDEELLHRSHGPADIDVGAVEGPALLLIRLIHHVVVHLAGGHGEGRRLRVEGPQVGPGPERSL
jgi:hypothetical protein